MRRMLILIVPGLLVLLAQSACQSGGTDPFACLTNEDCPEDCFCNDELGFFLCRSGEDNNDFCGGTCDRETACPEGTECQSSHTIEHDEIDDIVVFSCLPDSGTGGSGGAGGSGGTGGSEGTPVSCDVCGQLDCAELSDDAFVEGDWEEAVVAQDGTVSYAATQGIDGEGNDGPYRLIRHDVGVDSLIWIAHLRKDAIYDSSDDGAIVSVHYSMDGRALEGSRQASIRSVAQQDGRWYWSPWNEGYGLINEGDWESREWSDAGWDGIGHSVPIDLTEDGAPITFGFASGASHTGPDPTTRNTGVDNWRVIICNE